MAGMTVRILHGDCLEIMPTLDKVDAVVTDPPYHLVSISKRWTKTSAADRAQSPSGPHRRTSAGFMGKKWDGGDVAFRPDTWAKCFDLLPPGGWLLAFAGTRTYHRMACAIEDAGFEIRDQIQWLYGSGFPKSHNLDGERKGWGTALKPAHEPICMARKPLSGTVAANVLEHGTGALNVDGCRVDGGDAPMSWSSPRGGIWKADSDAQADRESNMAGRWPANVIHDGSPEVMEAFARFGEAPGQQRAVRGEETARQTVNVYGDFKGTHGIHEPRLDTGTAARFFYSAKADSTDRLNSKHPTVKPVDLMAYLVRLVTPPGGTVLDPFAGSGTTGMACLREGFDAVLIEREAEYIADINARLDHVSGMDTPLFSEAPA